MDRPAPPLNHHDVVGSDPTKFLDYFKKAPTRGDYLPWDKLRYKTAPTGLTHEQWWAVEKVRRLSMLRELPLKTIRGSRFPSNR